MENIKFISDEVKESLNKMKNLKEEIKKFTKEESLDFLKRHGFKEDKKISFELDSNQVEKLEEWKLKHKNCKSSTIGSKYKHSFISTGLGVISKVKCLDCGKKIDLTDSENW